MLKQPQLLSIRELGKIGPAGAMLASVDAQEGGVHNHFLLVADDGGTQQGVRVGDEVAARLGWELVLGHGEEEAEGPERRQTWQVAWGPV